MLQYLALYFCFLLVISAIFYTVKNNYKHLVLFATSLGIIAFISWKIALYALIFSTVNYFLGILLQTNKKDDKLRLRYFWSAIFIDIGFLAFFKYIYFFFDGLSGLVPTYATDTPFVTNSIILPLGISYYTFQALGYIIRINRGSEKAENNYFKFVTYLIFFPKFLSGPVERSNRFFPQINNLGGFKKESVSEGFRLLLWGAFKKFAIASNLYLPVHQIYSDVTHYSGIQLLIIFIIQTVYIYMEFSGYTDMALGTAKFFGINLTDNFNRPFLARNISEFWRRWHISLSSWCNDFIYSPFIVKYRKYENFAIVTGVFLTFLVIGIWHAANWTFITLGLLQAVAIVYEFYSKRNRLKIASNLPKSLNNAVSRTIVFLFVCFSMVFFFSPSIHDAWYFIGHLFSFGSGASWNQPVITITLAFSLSMTAFLLIFIAEMLNEKGKNLLSAFLKQPVWLRWTFYSGLVLAIYLSDPELLQIEYMRF